MQTAKQPRPAAKTPTPAASLRVYNTLSKTKEPFQPVSPGKVGIYLCGPTVYKPSHIGHMVGPVIFDAVKRYLRYSGYDVTFVVNITDVDDKLIAESTKRGTTMKALAEEMTADYHRNLSAMGVDTIDHFPRATDHMQGIIDFTQALIDRGFAYESDGDVFFEVARDADYGKLTNRTVDQLQGAGGEAAERKRSAADFALWKRAKAGEPSWDSPWGQGRPGWHIECSAMSKALLGETFDIHGGGLDLVFPHHENEIAQSESCHGRPQAKYWMHNGLMQASSEAGKLGGRATRSVDAAAQQASKISKSTGATAFSELLQQFHGETVRFFLLSTHYRSPIDYSIERLKETEKALDAFYRYFQRYQRVTGEDFYGLEAPATREAGDRNAAQDGVDPAIQALRQKFLEAMDDDFNTGAAIGLLFDLTRTLNRTIDTEKLEGEGKQQADKIAALRVGTLILKELVSTLGLFRQAVPTVTSAAADELAGKLMQLLIELRAEARKSKNFAMADAIRQRLAAIGVVLEDRPDGTLWTREH